MRPSLIATLGASVALGLAVAATTAGTSAQSSDRSEMASFICRPAVGNETPSAKMMDGRTLLVCRPFGVQVKTSDGTLKTIGTVSAKSPAAPDFSGALTPAQVSEAWTRWVQHALRIDPATLHSP
jgi:hypothetical protein